MMQPSILATICACCLIFGNGNTAHAGSADSNLADAFTTACLKALPTLDGAADRMAKAGYVKQKDDNWKKGDVNFYVGDRGSAGTTTCGGFLFGADPIKTADLVLAAASRQQLSPTNAKRKGRRTSIEVAKGGKSFLIKIEPMMQDFTYITIAPN